LSAHDDLHNRREGRPDGGPPRTLGSRPSDCRRVIVKIVVQGRGPA